MVYVLAMVSLILLMYAGLWGTGRSLGSLPLLFGPSLGYLATAVFWHTYIRVVPGRLDVVQWPVFRRNRSHKLIIADLRTARVLVNSRKAYVRISSSAPGVGDFVFSTWLLPNRRQLEYMILLAAVSTHKPGPMEPPLVFGERTA